MAISLYLLNFALCVMAGMLCILVLTSRRINTMHILALLYVTLTGMAFVFWLIDGMAHPEELTTMAVAGRAFVLGGFVCWLFGRIQCEHGLCQLRPENWGYRRSEEGREESRIVIGHGRRA